MPGVLIVEAVAQAGESASTIRSRASKKLVVLSKLHNIKFRKIVVPGDSGETRGGNCQGPGPFCHDPGTGLVDKEIVVEERSRGDRSTRGGECAQVTFFIHPSSLVDSGAQAGGGRLGRPPLHHRGEGRPRPEYAP